MAQILSALCGAAAGQVGIGGLLQVLALLIDAGQTLSATHVGIYREDGEASS